MRDNKPLLRHRKGYALLLVLVFLLALSGVAFAIVIALSGEMRGAGAGVKDKLAFYVAEAGRAKARWALTAGGEAVGWHETAEPFGAGSGKYIVTTAYSDPPTNAHVTITSDGYFPDSAKPVAKRRVEESAIPLSGSNIALVATATASSTFAGNTPGKAIDGVSSTKWKSSQKDKEDWLKLDLGGPKSFNKVVINCANVDRYSIECSEDDSIWTMIKSSAAPPPATPIVFAIATARYVRLNVTGNRPEVNEFEVYNQFGQGKFTTSL